MDIHTYRSLITTSSLIPLFQIDDPGKQGDQFGPGYPQFTLHTARSILSESFLHNFTLKLGGKAERVYSIIREIIAFHEKVQEVSIC